MTTHRLTRPSFPATFRALDTPEKVDLIARAVIVTGGMSLLMFLASGWMAGLAWLALGALDLLALLRLYRRMHMEREALERGKKRVMDDMTDTPGGAPMVADIRAHCGCTLRYAYADDLKEWVPVEVTDSAEHCLEEAR